MAASPEIEVEAVEGPQAEQPAKKKVRHPFKSAAAKMEVARLVSEGKTLAEVGEQYGVTSVAVGKILRTRDAQQFMAELREAHADKLSGLYSTSIDSLTARIADPNTETRDFLNLLRRAMEVVLGQTTPGRPTLPAAVPPAVVIDQRQGPAQPTMTMAQLVAQAAQMAQNQQDREEEE